MAIFRDRATAGEQLANLIIPQLHRLSPVPTVTVYALPRGGIPVAIPIAQQLQCPLDVIVAKKITTPANPELALGAVTADGQAYWANHSGEEATDTSLSEALQTAQGKAQQQLEQFADYRPTFSPHPHRHALLVDDGIATGMTMVAAMQAVRRFHPAQIWLCAPVAPRILVPSLEKWCEEVNGGEGGGVILLHTPQRFGSVSRFYESFSQVAMAQAIQLMQHHNDSG